MRLLHKFDWWLCCHLPLPLRTQWNRLWIRKDELHPSLDLDSGHLANLSPEESDSYMLDLIRRRQIAHQRDLDKTA